MAAKPKTSVRIAAEFQELFHQIGFTPAMVLENPDIRSWRKLPDRENCIWDLRRPDGRIFRIHVKRYPPSRSRSTPAEIEALGYRLLESQEIPSARLIAWGRLANRRSFVLVADLTGYSAADKLIQGGQAFEKLLIPTADLAAKLHLAGLHHRDLYLCHFFARVDAASTDIRLIDVGRVRRLPGFLTRRRWIVKDLAQFWYSTQSLPITDAQRNRWLDRYIAQTRIARPDALRQSVKRKAAGIAAHDANLRRKQPGRNISIPEN
jgi:lipopolysaccharide kinase (Kdo/WaaP) family protein